MAHVLAVYAVFALALVWRLWWVQQRREHSDVSGIPLIDPYLIACLRGGQSEAVAVAIVALVDRGLLKPDDEWVEAVDAGAVHTVAHPLERALLRHFATPGLARSAAADPDVRASVEPLEDELVQHGLLPSQAQADARAGRLVLAVGVLWSVALLPWVALAPEQSTVACVSLLLAIPASVAAGLLFGGRRTAAGNRMVADMRELFQGLRSRRDSLTPGQSGLEPALLAAVYGLTWLPAGWAFANTMFRGPAHKHGTGGDPKAGGCGGCGSSSGGSGGDGCGSGCGGGCGGCGGCGA